MPIYEDKKTGTYYVKVNYTDKNGEYKQIKRTGFKTKKMARETEARLLNEVNEGTYVKQSKIITNDHFLNFLEDKKPNISRGTYNMYHNLITLHILPVRENYKGKKVGLGDRAIGKTTARHIKDLYNHLFESETVCDDNIQKCHTIIKGAFRQAKIEGLIKDNPADLVDRPKARKTEMKIWSLTEARQFLRAAEGDPLYIFFLLALTTGMRRGEILGLPWENVNLEKRTIGVTQILSYDGKKIEEGTKTAAGRRSIRIDEETSGAIDDHRKKMIERRMRYADVFEDNDLVLCTKFGNPISPQNTRRTFKRLIEVAGVPDIRIHDLRHTHVTMLIKNRETPQAIAERLGWADTRMIDNYAHITPDIQEDLAENFGKSFYA